MTISVQLWDWEKDVLRQILYTAPEGDGGFISIREAATAAGHGFVHPDKLKGFSRKLTALGYGQANVRPIQVPSIDIDFKLSSSGHQAAIELAKGLQYRSPVARLGPVTWAAVAALVSSCAAIVSAMVALKVFK